MLYEYLKSQYSPNEPIFVSDIKLPVTDVNLRQMFKVLCDSGKIIRFDTGVYYLPKATRLRGGAHLGADAVARCKYIEKNGSISGYYSGYTFANQLGITSQVPYTTEIVSNNASASVREINLKGRRMILRKSRVPVNADNYKVLQLLELLKDIDQYADEETANVPSIVRKYISDTKIRREDIDRYIGQYPDRVYRSIYEMRLYEVFA